MYKDTIKQLLTDLDDLLSDIEADDLIDISFETQQDLLRTLDEAYSSLEDARRLL